MLWIENELAEILAGFSAVVIFALIFSLIESKLILPSHLSFVSQKKYVPNLFGRFMALREVCQRGLQLFSQNLFEPSLKFALRHQATTLMLFGSVMLIAWGGLVKGTIPAVFFPEIPGRYGTATVIMDQDASPELTNRNAIQMESAIASTNYRLQNKFSFDQPVITKSLVAVDNGKKIEATIELSKAALQGIPSQSILEAWQLETGYVEGHYSIDFSLADEPAGGTAIAISANTREIAKQVAEQLKGHIESLPGVGNPFDDSQAGRRQLSVTLNERGQQLGLTQRDLAVLVGGAFGEIELHRLLDDGEEVSVIVALPEQARKSVSQLKSTRVALPNGGFASLGQVSDIKYSRTPEVLYRRNRDEVVTIQWRHNRDVSSPESVWQALETRVLPNLLLQYPGVKVTPVGEFAEITEVQSGFRKALVMTLFLIYVLLAIPLKSYFQPLIIMSVIPFGFAGAVLGHALMGVSVSILSLFGMMAMTGVVVNDSLVLMTRFNQLHRGGMPLTESLFESGKSRMKAIFLTTVTTVCGLLPLLMENSETAQYLKPAAISLVFGELFATPITLILIPVLLGLGKKLKLTKAAKGNIDNTLAS